MGKHWVKQDGKDGTDKAAGCQAAASVDVGAMGGL